MVRGWLDSPELPGHATLAALAEERCPVWVWGVNLPIQKLLGLSPLGRCHLAGLVDRDPHKQGRTVAGLPIRSPEVLAGASVESVVVVWGGPYADEIRGELRRLGFVGRVLVL